MSQTTNACSSQPLREKKLGEAPTSNATKNAAIKLYNKYQTIRKEPIMDQTTATYIAEDNLQAHLTKFCSWLANISIPRGFDKIEFHSWSTQERSKYLKASTKVEYAGKVKEVLREKFPNHPHWNGHIGDDSSWWSVIRKGLEKDATRTQNNNEDETTTLRPLYLENLPGYQPVEVPHNNPNSRAINGDISKVDLNAIIKSMIKEDDTRSGYTGIYEQRAQLLMTWHAVARGGEAKFNSYSDWLWNPYFKVVDTQWIDIKTINTYSMPMMPHRYNYRVCWYHAMGCYYLLEDGLFRRPDELERAQRVFPKLHKISDSSVTKKLTGTIRKFIPAKVSTEVRNSFSAKSMRKGAINFLAAHSAIDYYASHVRSGHSFGTSQESYIDRNALVLSISAAEALNGYQESVYPCPYTPPNFECLGSEIEESGMIDRFIDELYTISDQLPQFQSGGHLRPFLRTVTAVLIMSIPALVDDFGVTNKVYRKLFQAAQRAKLFDANNSDKWVHPGAVLEGWRTHIQDNFNLENDFDAMPQEVATATMLDRVGSQLAQIEKQTKELNQALALQRQTSMQKQQLEGILLSIQKEQQAVKAMASQNKEKLSFIKTPPRQRRQFAQTRVSLPPVAAPLPLPLPPAAAPLPLPLPAPAAAPQPVAPPPSPPPPLSISQSPSMLATNPQVARSQFSQLPESTQQQQRLIPISQSPLLPANPQITRSQFNQLPQSIQQQQQPTQQQQQPIQQRQLQAPISVQRQQQNQPKDVNALLMRNRQAQNNSSSCKGILLERLLLDITPIKWNAISQIPIPATMKGENEAKCIHALRLAKIAGSEEHKLALSPTGIGDKSKRKEAASGIAHACMETLLKLEIEVGLKPVGSTISSRQKGTVVALGMRYQKYQTKKDKQQQLQQKLRRQQQQQQQRQHRR